MEFVSATVKRDKVRRMVENGTIKKLAKKKTEAEEMQKEAEKVGENGVSQKEADKVEESNGNIDEKAAEDVGNISDQIDDDDCDSKPEPIVVFL